MYSSVRKWIAAAFFSSALTFGVGGCGTNVTNNTGGAPATITNTTNGTATVTSAHGGPNLSRIRSSGSLKVGTEGTYAPFTYHDASDRLTGFDVDLAAEVAKRIGVKADFVETPWDGMFAGLSDRRFDMVANEVGILPNRQKTFLFSRPYIQSPSVLIVKDSDNSIHSFADLKGKKAAQSITSNYATEAKQDGATIVDVQGFNEAIQLVKSGRADATLNDKLSFLQMQKQNPNLGLKIAATASDAVPSGFMFRKDETDLVTAVNTALQSMFNDGTYANISKKYFGAVVLPNGSTKG